MFPSRRNVAHITFLSTSSQGEAGAAFGRQLFVIYFTPRENCLINLSNFAVSRASPLDAIFRRQVRFIWALLL
jgi:hypothetical protein